MPVKFTSIVMLYVLLFGRSYSKHYGYELVLNSEILLPFFYRPGSLAEVNWNLQIYHAIMTGIHLLVDWYNMDIFY